MGAMSLEENINNNDNFDIWNRQVLLALPINAR